MTGAILAGGMSRRMGFNKAFIEIDGQTILQRTASLFSSVFDDTFMVANDIPLYQDAGLRVYADIIKDAGSLGGVYTAIFHSSSDYVFVAACDMPFLDRDAVIKTLTARGLDAAVPVIDGRAHPLHAIYSKRCLKAIDGMIREGNLRINDLLKRIRVRELTEGFYMDAPIARSVENINTQDELSRIRGCK